MPTDCAASYRSSPTPQTQMALKHLRAVHHCRSAGWLLSFLLRQHQHPLPAQTHLGQLPASQLNAASFFNSPFVRGTWILKLSPSLKQKWLHSANTLRVHLEWRWKKYTCRWVQVVSGKFKAAFIWFQQKRARFERRERSLHVAPLSSPLLHCL